jgi:hypothetical protein
MSDKLTLISIMLIVGTFVVWLVALTIPKYEMTKVKIVKIHTVEDYAREKESSIMEATFPHVIYEVVETGERYIDRNPKGKLDEIITVKRQIGGMR